IDLVDSDNEMLALGEKYVIFLLTVFTDDYKKGINTYDDFLSAPSETFSLKNTIKAVTDISVEKEPARPIHINPDLPVLSPYAIHFTADETDQKYTEYRCMFLSYNEELFTANDLDYFEESIEITVVKKEIQYAKNDIDQYKGELDTIRLKIKQVNEEFEKKIKNLDPNKDKELIRELNEEKDRVLNNYSQIQTEINSKLLLITAKLDELYLSFEKIAAKKLPKIKNKKGFFFNLKLAENVASGNYTTAVASSRHSQAYEVKIDPTTTDNFGNALIDGKLYIPVVLSIYSGSETNENQYNNNLSDWENEEPFPFTIKNNQ
ncbi:MAG: hypothetical protein ABI441_08605, partial [Flavobacterium sp.]